MKPTFPEGTAKPRTEMSTRGVAALIAFSLTGSACRIFEPSADQDAMPSGSGTWLHYDATRRGGFVVPRSTGHSLTVAASGAGTPLVDSHGAQVKDMDGNPIFVERGGRTGQYLLSENSPDVASSISAELVAKTKGVEISGKLTESLLELGKRTETVTILRECLYRLAELTNNVDLSPAEASTLYSRVLDATVLLSLAENTSSVAEIAKAIADAVRSSHGSGSAQPQAAPTVGSPSPAGSARPSASGAPVVKSGAKYLNSKVQELSERKLSASELQDLRSIAESLSHSSTDESLPAEIRTEMKGTLDQLKSSLAAAKEGDVLSPGDRGPARLASDLAKSADAIEIPMAGPTPSDVGALMMQLQQLIAAQQQLAFRLTPAPVEQKPQPGKDAKPPDK